MSLKLGLFIALRMRKYPAPKEKVTNMEKVPINKVYGPMQIQFQVGLGSNLERI